MLVIFVTAARLPLAGAAAVLVVLAGPAGTAAWAALGVLLAMEATDALDGILARRLGVAGRFGELFDPYCDSVARLIVYFGLASAGLAPAWLVLVMAIRDVSVAYARISCVISGRRVSARLSGKLKAIVQGAGAIVLVAALALSPAAGTERLLWLRAGVAGLVAGVTVWSLADYLLAAFGRKKTPPPGV